MKPNIFQNINIRNNKYNYNKRNLLKFYKYTKTSIQVKFILKHLIRKFSKIRLKKKQNFKQI